MAGENLLDQRGARTRHADDENRHGRRLPAAGVGLEHFRGEDALDVAKKPERRFFIVIDQRALGGIASAQLCKGAAAIADVAIGLSQREIELQPGRRLQVRSGSQRLDPGKLWIAARKPMRCCEIGPEAGIVGVDPACFCVGLFGLFQLSEFFQNRAESIVSGGEILFQRNGLPAKAESIVQLALHESDRAETVQRFGELGNEPQGAQSGFRRLAEASGEPVGLAQIGMNKGKLGRGFCRSPQINASMAAPGASNLQRDQTENMFGFVTVRLLLERAPAKYRRLIDPAFPAMPLRQHYRVVDYEFTRHALILRARTGRCQMTLESTLNDFAKHGAAIAGLHIEGFLTLFVRVRS